MKKEKPFNPPPLMSHEQIATIKAEIDDIKKMIKGDDESKKSDVGYFNHAVSHLNVDEVKKSISQRQRQLKEYTPKKLTGKAANDAYANVKKIKEWIKQNIPKETYIAYPRGKDPVRKTRDFEKAVQQQVEWQKNGQKKIDEYHYWMRRIDPDAPREDFNRLIRERA